MFNSELRGRKKEYRSKSKKLNLSEREFNMLTILANKEGLDLNSFIRKVAIYQAYENIFGNR